MAKNGETQLTEHDLTFHKYVTSDNYNVVEKRPSTDFKVFPTSPFTILKL